MTAFAVVNVIAVPLAGRLAWRVMSSLDAQQHTVFAVVISLLTAFGILAANVLLCASAARRGAPRPVLTAMWGWTVGTFALTIGAGFFSPLNLLAALVTH